MDQSSLSSIWQAGFCVALALLYGLALCLYYWNQDRKNTAPQSFKNGALWVFGLPILLACIGFVMPGKEVLEPMFGRAFNAYAYFFMAVFSYLPPAIIAALILIAKKDSLKRWFYSALVFAVGMIFLVLRIVSAIDYAKIHPDLSH